MVSIYSSSKTYLFRVPYYGFLYTLYTVPLRGRSFGLRLQVGFRDLDPWGFLGVCQIGMCTERVFRISGWFGFGLGGLHLAPNCTRQLLLSRRGQDGTPCRKAVFCLGFRAFLGFRVGCGRVCLIQRAPDSKTDGFRATHRPSDWSPK